MPRRDDRRPQQDEPRAARRPIAGVQPEPAIPPRPFGEGAWLPGGILFGLHVRQVRADLDAAARDLAPRPWPAGLGEDAVQAHRWLGMPRAENDTVVRSFFEKRERFGEDDLDRHLSPPERGFVVAITVNVIGNSFWDLSAEDKEATLQSCLSKRPVHDQAGAVVGPPLTVAEAALELALRAMTRGEIERVMEDRAAGAVPRPVERKAPPGQSPLAGSPRQVAWAETLRAYRWPRIAAHVARRQADPAVAPDLRDCYRAVLDELDRAAARWWIDHRSEPVRPLVDAMARRLADQRCRTRDQLRRHGSDP
jgi:hypothetical protein